MPTDLDRHEAWLSREDLDNIRGRVPILYVAAVPVRVADNGSVTRVGLLLRASDTGTMDRELIAGRVNYHERVRDALVRHLEKDLGPMAAAVLADPRFGMLDRAGHRPDDRLGDGRRRVGRRASRVHALAGRAGRSRTGAPRRASQLHTVSAAHRVGRIPPLRRPTG